MVKVSKLGFITLLCMLCIATCSEKMEFVFQYTTQSERTPLYAQDRQYNVTKNNYKQKPNELTLTGLRNSFSQGEHFKEIYSDHHKGFLSPHYNPSEFFVRTYPDNPSVMSAYSFLLGVYPQEVEGLGLIQEKGVNEPLRDAHVDDARRALYLDRAKDWSHPVYIHSGNSDGLFFKDISDTYPGLKKDFDKNLKEAGMEFENNQGRRLYLKLSQLLNAPINTFDFQNVAKYLDDYISAFSNGKSTAPFNFDNETLDMIVTYYNYLIKNGLLRDPALNKVLAHPFLYTLLREILFKAQDPREISMWEGP